MKIPELQNFTHWDLTMMSSILALFSSYLSISIQNNNLMVIISYVSAIILCITSIIKFIDLIVDKWKSWKEKD